MAVGVGEPFVDVSEAVGAERESGRLSIRRSKRST